jgi:hypothetical protein
MTVEANPKIQSDKKLLLATDANHVTFQIVILYKKKKSNLFWVFRRIGFYFDDIQVVGTIFAFPFTSALFKVTLLKEPNPFWARRKAPE